MSNALPVMFAIIKPRYTLALTSLSPCECFFLNGVRPMLVHALCYQAQILKLGLRSPGNSGFSTSM